MKKSAEDSLEKTTPKVANNTEIITLDNPNDKTSQKLRNIIGTASLPSNFDEEKELRSYLEKKHC